MRFFLLLLCITIFKIEQNDTHGNLKIKKCYRYNACEIEMNTKNITLLAGVSIVKYKIVNTPNLRKDTLCQYFLIKHLKDTFNIVMLSHTPITDSMVKKSFGSTDWNFEKRRDTTCFDFKSQFDLKAVINTGYPVLFGELFMFVQ